jgi:hypothetical protein
VCSLGAKFNVNAPYTCSFILRGTKNLLVIGTGPAEMEMAGKWTDVVMTSYKDLEKF